MLTPAFICAVLSEQSPKWVDQTLTGGVSISTPVKLKRSTGSSQDIILSDSVDWNGDTKSYQIRVNIGTIKNSAKLSSAAIMGKEFGSVETGAALITSVKDLVHQGWQGLELDQRSISGLDIEYRAYRVGDRFVMTMGTWPTGRPKPAAINRCLDSVRFPTQGPAKGIGPDLNRFPLGTSGLSALFPSAPKRERAQGSKGSKAAEATYFDVNYGLRTFVVAYQDLSAATVAKLTGKKLLAAEAKFNDEALIGFHGKKRTQREVSIAGLPAVYTDFISDDSVRLTLLAVLKGNRMVVTLHMAPAAYEDHGIIDKFLNSVE